ncbi:Metallo-dependent phosphatase [Westerdykella ornata]|uniref:Metallo-dependent phosphatase n=1 Tax=Westerdykella ornata TaxID=318751 RepID=A0A6A6JKD5_WESOR|nr:Metallo-dependent phosphatase [Westerdykella ornata]KAF2276573.1 Metallo-dependent phosphatase [Westerdykella ornata]
MSLPTRRLWAISDLHLNNPINAEELRKLKPHPGDGLILCGDIGETLKELKLAFEITTARFRYVFWTPGNHELWLSTMDGGLRGQAKYEKCVELARSYGVKTPEDPYMLWLGRGDTCIIAPIFTLYDYSYRPNYVSRERAVGWATEGDRLPCTDEYILDPYPYESRDAWCDALVARFGKKLEAACEAYGMKYPLVIAGHWPLRRDLVDLPDHMDRWHMWCGTTQTEDWHTKYNAKVVVNGHMHWRRTDWRGKTRFEEVSLGYQGQWERLRSEGITINDLLREILPGPKQIPPDGQRSTVWLREVELLSQPGPARQRKKEEDVEPARGHDEQTKKK